MATLSIVGTPIGNLEDITTRALRVLREADIIVCEDTRVTKRLLNHYKINDKQLAAYNEQKSGVNIGKILSWFEEGKNLALVTDAGTPGISDPGSILVAKVREKYGDSVKIESIPGPAALTAAVSISGIPLNEFIFFGFLPHKKGRETLFKEIAASKRSVIFYESPHRIMKTLQSLVKHVPNRKIVIARELTKIHEEILSGLPGELASAFKMKPEKQRGEFVIIVSRD